MKKSVLSEWRNRENRSSQPKAIPKAPEDAVIPLTSGQQRLWFLQRLLPENPVYNYPESFIFKGDLNIEALDHGLQCVVRDNEILRSSYHFESGRPIHKIHPELKIDLKVHDVSHLPKEEKQSQKTALFMSDARRPFDLEQLPLLRATLVKLSSTEHVLLLTMHHIIFDKWSMDLLMAELATHYRSYISGNSVVPKHEDIPQFPDYAVWLKNKPLDPAKLDYWKKKLGGDIPLLQLPTDHILPSQPSYKGTSYRSTFSEELSKRVLDLSKNLETTPYVLLLSVYYVLLHKYSSQEDILIGSPISHRDERALEQIIGFFDETIVLRTGVDPNMSFSQFVNKVRKTVLEAFSNKEVPFETLVKEISPKRSLSTNPFFRAMFIYHDVKSAPIFSDELNLSHSFFNPGVSKFDLTLYIANDKGILSSGFEYTTDIFEESTIIRFQEHLTLLLEAVTSKAEEKIVNFKMLTTVEKEFFLRTPKKTKGKFYDYRGIHQIIERVAKDHPEKAALTFKDKTITYTSLNERADAIAHRLLEHTGGSNELIGLCVERSTEMIIGMLAILKAGCGYVPLDPKYPKDRLDFILNDAGCKIVLTQKPLVHYFKEMGPRLFLLENQENIPKEKLSKLPEIQEDDIAYIIYTSGSTGRPKGVPITHKNIISSTEGRLDFYHENPESFLLMSSISFDSSKAGIFWTLCTGGNLIITEDRVEQDIAKLEDLIKEHRVTHTLLLPTLYKLILDHSASTNLSSLKTVIVAGEACLPSLCNAHFANLPQVKLFNEYGPTEATVWCTAYEVKSGAVSGAVPIGKPVAGNMLYLLDKNRTLVPYGSTGEIYIGGAGLAKGYWNRPDLTQELFVANPFDDTVGEKLYKTGDVARYDLEGNIEFLGRVDEQVKIRGYRIELDEIEKAIIKDHEVSEAVVLVDGKSEVKKLVAFVTGGEGLETNSLKASLKKTLPDFMIPTSFVILNEFPRLPNGKVDKKALSSFEITLSRQEGTESELPKGEVAVKLAEIWKEVLDLEFVGMHDNFFELGGDSIRSIEMLAKARKQGINLSPNQIFEYQTIKELESFVVKNKGQDDQWDYLVPFRKEGNKKPLFCLHAGGGNVFFYRGLADFIDSERPLYGIQASGMYGKKHKMHKTIAEMADDYIEAINRVQTKGPYNIMVYCFSASVGHEMAIKMKARGERCNLIVMDTMAKPWTLNTPHRLKIRLVGFLKRFLRMPFSTLKSMILFRWEKFSRGMNERYGKKSGNTLEELQTNLERLSFSYDWKPFDGNISLILTEKAHESLNQETISSWQEFASGGVKILKTPGNHSFVFKEDNLAHVAERIEECIIDEPL
ncbi:non-ribosomal peptide synthetase [Pareuzebyella sediminis]|uniref:non-ribosomal peptide synthetase n=1 Tax=Pareuzebyella sediminis TaxID=2607998 RepID=UPI0011EBCC11|nr:non-ribosomal peptide synthetase [Pareuzebyella sediminis]